MQLKYVFFILISVTVFVTCYAPVLAADNVVNTKPPAQNLPKLENPINANNVQELILTITDFIIFLGTLVAVIMFIWVGFKFVMAQGEPKAITDAKHMFFAVVVGTAILIGSKLIVEVIKNTFIATGVVNERLLNNP